MVTEVDGKLGACLQMVALVREGFQTEEARIGALL